MTDCGQAFALIDQHLARHVAGSSFPGVALAVTDRERTLLTATLGFADTGARRPVTPDTLFEIGSIGKPFTALAVLQLVEAGKLDLDAPVSDYLPWFAVRSAFPGHDPSSAESHGRHYSRHRRFAWPTV